MCSCQRTRRTAPPELFGPRWLCFGKNVEQVVGVTGVEPVTLRLSSACSNQLSYTPEAIADFGLPISDCGFSIRRHGFSQSAIQTGGAEETRTPDL